MFLIWDLYQYYFINSFTYFFLCPISKEREIYFIFSMLMIIPTCYLVISEDRLVNNILTERLDIILFQITGVYLCRSCFSFFIPNIIVQSSLSLIWQDIISVYIMRFVTRHSSHLYDIVKWFLTLWKNSHIESEACITFKLYFLCPLNVVEKKDKHKNKKADSLIDNKDEWTNECLVNQSNE